MQEPLFDIYHAWFRIQYWCSYQKLLSVVSKPFLVVVLSELTISVAILAVLPFRITESMIDPGDLNKVDIHRSWFRFQRSFHWQFSNLMQVLLTLSGSLSPPEYPPQTVFSCWTGLFLGRGKSGRKHLNPVLGTKTSVDLIAASHLYVHPPVDKIAENYWLLP